MRLSLETAELQIRFGEEKAFELIKNAGFDGIDFSFDIGGDFAGIGEDYKEYARYIRLLLEKNGLDCVQAHAPYKLKADKKFDITEPHFLEIVRSMEAAAIMGAEKIVVHTIDTPPSADVNEVNSKFYKSLKPYAEKFGILIGIENLFTWIPEHRFHIGRFSKPREMNAFVKSLNSPCFAVCADVGHAAITGTEPEEYIANIDSDILKVLHIHDNDHYYDRHQLPFEGVLNWQAITTSLKEKGYNGDLSYEISSYIRKYPDELVPDALAHAVRVGRYLISQIEGK